MLKHLVFLLFFPLALTPVYGQNKTIPATQKNPRLDLYTSTADLPPAKLNGYRLFLNGEEHYRPGNEKIAWDLLMYLYEREHVRVLAGEISVSTAYLLNYYSEAGSETDYESLLAENLSSLETTWFWEKLYKFNESKSHEDRIYIRGVDSGSNAEMAAKAMRLILEKNKINNELTDYLYFLEDGRFHSMEVAQKFLRLYNGNSDKYHGLFKTEEVLFVDIIKELICESCANYIHTDSARWATRESHIYNNMLHVFDEHPDVNVFGKFGSAHTSLNPVYISSGSLLCPSFASRLFTNADSPVKGKVCVFKNEYFGKKNLKKYTWADSLLLSFPKNKRMNTYVFFQPSDSLKQSSLKDPNPQFRTEVKYSFKKSIQQFKKDSLKILLDDCEIGYKAIEFGISYFNEANVNVGYKYLVRHLSPWATDLNMGVELSSNVKTTLYGLSYDIKAGHYAMLGFKATVYDDGHAVSFYLKPQVGVAYHLFSLMYGYEFRTIGTMVQNLNRQNFMLGMIVPFGGRY